jgi:ABC-type lipoprotein export system ATPase subunit
MEPLATRPRVIVLGTTGSGKSTLLNSLSGDATGSTFAEGDSFETGTKEFKMEAATLHGDDL